MVDGFFPKQFKTMQLKQISHFQRSNLMRQKLFLKMVYLCHHFPVVITLKLLAAAWLNRVFIASLTLFKIFPQVIHL